MLVLDFETEGIAPRPRHPPEPVGVAMLGQKLRKYHAWGHPKENNTTRDAIMKSLKRLPHDHSTILCHNAPFDISVLHEICGAPLPKRIEDTQVLAFLLDPYGELSLKPLAERYLDMPPEERDAVR